MQSNRDGDSVQLICQQIFRFFKLHFADCAGFRAAAIFLDRKVQFRLGGASFADAMTNDSAEADDAE